MKEELGYQGFRSREPAQPNRFYSGEDFQGPHPGDHFPPEAYMTVPQDGRGPGMQRSLSPLI